MSDSNGLLTEGTKAIKMFRTQDSPWDLRHVIQDRCWRETNLSRLALLSHCIHCNLEIYSTFSLGQWHWKSIIKLEATGSALTSHQQH